MKALLWLGPEDGREIQVNGSVVARGTWIVPGRLKSGDAQGVYRIRTARDGVADRDGKGRLTFDWEGWQC